MTAPVCPACDAAGMRIFFTEDSIPVNSCLLVDTEAEARSFPRGDMRLAFCPSCGFLSNTAFDRAKATYDARYEETQAFSPRFMAFAKDLASRWIERYDIRDKTVLEIGCGKGEFLVLMCEIGHNRGIGIDPGVHAERIDSEAGERIEWIADFYDERYSDLAADVVICRHTLEHIQPVGEFMAKVRRAIGDRLDTVVLFELPDVLRVLREVAFWDVYYEHCSYFSLGSLARLFRRSGFEVLDLELDYDDQYLLIEARPSATTPAAGAPLAAEDDLADLAAAVDHYSSSYADNLGRWRSDLRSVVESGQRAVIWGSGSKGVSYLTNLGITEEIRYAVDINPFKHGKYMAGVGQLIVPPEFLQEYRPDLVIAMNPVYRQEIQRDLDALGVTAKLIAV